MYRIDHINRYVSDVESVITFYCEALDYKVLGRGTKSNGRPYAILQGHQHELFISEREGFEVREQNFRHLGFAVDDVDKLLAELIKKGIAGPDQQVIVKEFSRQIYIQDPDGFEIDLIQWTNKEAFYEGLKATRI